MPPMPPETNTMRWITGRLRSRQASSCAASIKSSFISSFLAFNCEGDPHAAPDAQRSEAAFRVALLHFVEERHQHARAARADRMTERDRAAVDVHLLRVPAHLAIHR